MTKRKETKRSEAFYSYKVTAVKGRRLFEVVAEQIRQAIFRGKLETGHKLPPEREMAEQFQTSRVAVREALQELRKEGLIVIKRGYGGGAFVADFNRALRGLTDSFSNVVQLDQSKSIELTEVRTLLEPGMARLATERATENELETMELIVREQEEELQQGVLSRKHDMEFHHLVAEASHNAILSRIVAAVNDAIRDAIYHSPLTREMRTHVVNYHREILEAIRRRDGELAYRLMNEHVLDVLRHLRASGEAEKNRVAESTHAD